MFHFLAAAAAVGGLAAPALAQYPYQQQVPQPYPGQPGYGYGYQQGYGDQSPVGAIINQLLGNRYNVSDRTAVSQCANAAMVQAQSQYRGRYGGQYGYPQGYGYPPGYAAPTMRVTAITSVERRNNNNGLRVTGLMSSGYGGQYAGQYGGQYGYQGQHYAQGDVSFRCNVDYRGQVTNVRIGRNNPYRG
jgi:hypothetical protein